MSISFSSALYQTPGAQRFLNTLTDDLANRRSLLALLPVGIDPVEIWSTLRTELWRRDFGFEEISLPDLPQDHVPVAALSKALGVNWASPETPRTIANLMTAKNLPDIVQLEGFGQLTDTTRRDWTMFLTQWRQVSQNMADRGHIPMALCMIAPAVAVLPRIPESGVHLAVHWWWGFPSALEMHLLCRQGSEGAPWDAAARWREHLLPALAGSDISLVEYLWDSLRLSLEGLAARLRSFAEQRGWAADALHEWGAEELAASPAQNRSSQLLSPPARFRALWARGALSWTTEYGLELHAAALAVLGRNEELGHRLWRGQAELLLPLIDHTRLTLCDHLTRQYGHDWPIRWYQPVSPEEDAAVRNSPLACQWGYLEWLLKNCAHLQSEQDWLPLVSLSRWIRNEMAHYRPITFGDFEGLWREMNELPTR